VGSYHYEKKAGFIPFVADKPCRGAAVSPWEIGLISAGMEFFPD
jgi:hypothetical protein